MQTQRYSKENTKPGHQQAQLAFLALAALKVYLSLCFHVKFQPDLSSILAAKISPHPALSDIPETPQTGPLLCQDHCPYEM